MPKRLPMRGLRAAACALAALAACMAFAAFPERPVKIVVPFAAGGATDVVARALGQRLSEMWKQPVIVENRPGAGGNIGAEVVAQSAPDGYTLLLASPAEVAINEFLYQSMPFNPERDLVPVSKVASAPLVLLVHPSVPAKTVPELIAYLKAHPEGIACANSGTGGPQHLAAEQFRLLTGTHLTHVPYKGGAPAITDLLGGQVQMFFGGLPPALPQLRAGRLRALAVTTKDPSALLEGVPPVSATVPGFDIENWQGMFAPAGTPASIVSRIAEDVATVSRDAAYGKLLVSSGAAPAPLAPAAFAAFVDAERRKYKELVKVSGAKAD
ncbi:MAG TPA: tripartite tricarboxylate transporter substrate binding protein [Usitatibacter sp.]|jgi:tripartite-type tricarboxylate transporter receptor subunit TctC|nr:tripartite tricarboxylate transporter substrate binding protein [Usitatibacter sp.]